MNKVAVIQEAPILLNKQKTIEHAIALVDEAVKHDAELIIFPEAFIPGYPSWIWRLKAGGDWNLSEEIHSKLLNNAINLDNNDLSALYDTAKKHRITIICGIDERDSQLSQTTLYNTVITIGPDGCLQNRHRKLMPTNPERMVWGFGDASGLKVVQTPCGKTGALICWENYMPLARYALYAQGIEIYIAPTYDSGDGWLGTMQHIAREGCCWVIACGNALNYTDIPDNFPGKDELFSASEEWINPGDSIVIAPGGEIVTGPMRNKKGILYAEVDSEQVYSARRTLDITGHYARPDIFKLHVNTKPQSPVIFE